MSIREHEPTGEGGLWRSNSSARHQTFRADDIDFSLSSAPLLECTGMYYSIIKKVTHLINSSPSENQGRNWRERNYIRGTSTDLFCGRNPDEDDGESDGSFL